MVSSIAKQSRKQTIFFTHSSLEIILDLLLKFLTPLAL